ncbi:hypothetical protein AB1Y20_001320 [Prymnesium parvum]|uniref:Uncharacterized protein n=1 Tax=Prymnesium parvum TaxID=97485 RepID=A0AB34K7U4_PRYPA
MDAYETLVAMAGAIDRQFYFSGVAAMSEEQWPEFPCEDPTATELDDWLRVWNASLRGLDVEAILRGATPPSTLIALSRPTDLTDFVEVTVAAEPDTTKRLRHNAAVKKANRDEANRVESFDAGMLRIKNGFAGQLEKALRRTAPARLRRLKAACAIVGTAGAYDGAAMMTALRALVGARGPTQRQSSAWHEKQWERLRDSRLPDGCIADEYAAKCHELLEVHRPNFTRVRLEASTLTDVLIDFLPECNRIEGRGVRKDLIALGRHDDYEEAVRRCLEIVSDTTDEARVEARMAASVLPAGPARVAAMAAARTMTKSSPTAAAAAVAAAAASATNAARQKAAAAAKKAAAAPEYAAAAAATASKKTRLPDGQYCKFNSCSFPHKEGEPCWSDPDWAGPLPYWVHTSPRHRERIEKRRLEAGKRLGKNKVQKLALAPPPVPGNVVVPAPAAAPPGADADDDPLADG